MADADNDPPSDRPSATTAPSASFAAANASPSQASKPARISSRSPPARHAQTEVSAKHTPLESQPMTATTSTSSLLPDQTAKETPDTSAASPYGTRSRNKNGSTRPNYAEEPEIMEYEWTSTKKSHGPSETANAATTQTTLDFDKSSGANTRRSSNAAAVPSTTASRAAVGHAANHQIPGMSSFSVNPEAAAAAPIAPTRKRKAPGGTPATQHHLSTPTQSQASGPLRRQGLATNVQPFRTTTLMTFEGCQGLLKNGKLKADDGTWLAVGDQVYSVCEPPGEPYYLARILEFLHADNDHTQPVTEIKVNWFLRPRDCSRKANDTRIVYATFQTATIDITTLRGKCTVSHRTEVGDLDLYRKTPNAFWYDKLFDRYIHRFYEVIPIAQVINVPAKVKKVLDERWKYVIVEVGRGKELTSAIKSCKRCSGYCASNDSVDCAVCKNTYHMACVRPPLLKKPARGFGWSCGPCSRRQERRLEARNTPNQAGEGEEEEFVDEEEEDHGANTQNGHPNNLNDPSATESGTHPPTAEQLELLRLWPYRYLGLHCKLEDALDYDDRIYPRASSRLGPKHQANVHVWHGRPVRYVKSKEIKRKYMKGNAYKKDARFGKETTAAVDADKGDKEKRPRWVLDEPPGYIHRGEDHPNGDAKNSAQVIFRMPSVGDASSRGQDEQSLEVSLEKRAQMVDDYMEKAKRLAPNFGLQKYSTNFLDKALELFAANDYQSEKALAQLQNMKKRKDLKEPDLNKEDIRRFEEGVNKYGSELRNISRHMGKSQKYGEIVRFYYMWKKTPNGQQIWGNYDGRKGKKAAKQADSKLLDDVADDADDSAFDSAKAIARKRGFICKFCSRRQSSQWRRAPLTQPGTTVLADPSLKASKDKSAHLIVALCDRCGSLWRRLGIQYEDVESVSKKIASSGGRAWKRRIDEELLAELVGVNVSSDISMNKTTADAAALIGVEIPANLMIQPGQEGSKKKPKTAVEPAIPLEPLNGTAIELVKKKEVEKPIEPPPMVPEEPRIRLLPCAVCYEGEPAGEQLLICRYCRLTVHRNCYGAPETKSSEKWTCDMCSNDLGSTVSTTYECALCPVDANTDTDVALLMEPPRVSHKKKTDREREKERLEKEMIDQRAELYFLEQERRGRAKTPRQPLKRTSGNNWVHVICAIFHAEIKFSDAKLLEFAEGFAAVPNNKWTSRCKQCRRPAGACVFCAQCQAPVHAACAQQYGFNLLFDLSPVKQSRKDAISTVDMAGETGNATAAVYCREHGPKHTTHRLNEMDADSPLNALQKYARSHKQADTSQTGTQRKAFMVQTATRNAMQTAEAGGTRGAAAAAAGAANGNIMASSANRSSRVSPSTVTVQSDEVDEAGDRVFRLSEIPAIDSSTVKECSNCATHVSPKFYLITAKADGQVPQPVATATGNDRNEMASQPAVYFSNGTANGNHAHPREQLKAEKEDVAKATVFDGDHQWLCHKCHLRKLKNPTPPPRAPTPQPEPASVEPNEPESTSPQLPVPWPSQASVPAPPPASEPHRRYSTGPTEPPYYGPDHVPNGVHHSPLVAAPPPIPSPPPPSLPPLPATHYGPPPPPPLQPVYGPPPYPYRAEGRDRSHSFPRNPAHAPPPAPPPPPLPPPPAHYHGPLAHGPPYEPPSFQYRRDRATGSLIQVPYIPPGSRGQVPPPNPPLRSPQSAHRLTRSPHLRSPQVPTLPPPTHPHMTPPPRRARSPIILDQGPHGPPEADSNPFAVPHGSHTSPRQPYQNGSIYDSPHSSHARPETPDYGREGRWPSQHRDHGDRPTTNGASESPHLRNLLH